MVRLAGRARMTTRSAGPNSARRPLAACRSRRATRCRSTEPPTDFATMRPTRGEPASNSSSQRRACTTRDRCGARTPCRTARSNSVDRVIRFRAGSTPRRLEFRQSASRGLCGAAQSQSPGPLGFASAGGNHEPWPDGGCSAGTSVCPWPRPFLLITNSCSARCSMAPSGAQPLLTKYCSYRRAPG